MAQIRFIHGPQCTECGCSLYGERRYDMDVYGNAHGEDGHEHRAQWIYFADGGSAVVIGTDGDEWIAEDEDGVTTYNVPKLRGVYPCGTPRS